MLLLRIHLVVLPIIYKADLNTSLSYSDQNLVYKFKTTNTTTNNSWGII